MENSDENPQKSRMQGCDNFLTGYVCSYLLMCRASRANHGLEIRRIQGKTISLGVCDNTTVRTS